jgi:PIN domain nuclease of toxin-antitoxin system
VLILDTHACWWWTNQPSLLGRASSRAIAQADRLGIPSIVLWEIALLVRKKRLELGMRIEEWMEALREIPRVRFLSLDADAAVLAESLKMHPDPADRFIVATAIRAKAALVTKDRAIRSAKVVETIW